MISIILGFIRILTLIYLKIYKESRMNPELNGSVTSVFI